MPRRVLIDENLPIRLRSWLSSTEAVTVEFMGWKGVRNGELVRLAGAQGFAILITADRALALAPRTWAPLACVHLTSNSAQRLRSAAGRIDAACNRVLPGQVITVAV